jgi:hypothetical protein
VEQIRKLVTKNQLRKRQSCDPLFFCQFSDGQFGCTKLLLLCANWVLTATELWLSCKEQNFKMQLDPSAVDSWVDIKLIEKFPSLYSDSNSAGHDIFRRLHPYGILCPVVTLSGLTFQRFLLCPSPWWWRQYKPLKRRFISTSLHVTISHKAVRFILASVRTWISSINSPFVMKLKSLCNVEKNPTRDDFMRQLICSTTSWRILTL